MARIERLRLGDGEPLMFETIWIPASLCPDIHLHDLAGPPLNGVLEKEYGIILTKATESIEPRASDARTSKLLAIDKGVLLLHVEHTAYSGNGQIVYFVSALYRGDRVKFSVELRAE